MSIHAATTLALPATHGSGLGWVVAVGLLALAVIAIGYLTVCWLRPFTRCRHRASLHRAVFCVRCDGTGYRVRIGRHVLNRLRANHRRHGRDWPDGRL